MGLAQESGGYSLTHSLIHPFIQFYWAPPNLGRTQFTPVPSDHAQCLCQLVMRGMCWCTRERRPEGGQGPMWTAGMPGQCDSMKQVESVGLWAHFLPFLRPCLGASQLSEELNCKARSESPGGIS